MKNIFKSSQNYYLVKLNYVIEEKKSMVFNQNIVSLQKQCRPVNLLTSLTVTKFSFLFMCEVVTSKNLTF